MFQVFIKAVSIITKQIKSRLPLKSKTKGIHKIIPDHVNPDKRRYKLGVSWEAEGLTVTHAHVGDELALDDQRLHQVAAAVAAHIGDLVDALLVGPAGRQQFRAGVLVRGALGARDIDGGQSS